jgi:hypothetical protein
VRDPRPLKGYRKPDILTVEELLEEPARRRFLELAGAGALAVAAGGLLVACGPGDDDDDDDETGGDDDSEPYWDDDDGGIDDDDTTSDPLDCRLPQMGYHEVTIDGGDTLSYSVIAWVTDWSVVSYLNDNEGLALEVLDGVLSKHDCATLPAAAAVVESDMANALTDLIRDVGGLTCSVYEISLYIDECS